MTREYSNDPGYSLVDDEPQKRRVNSSTHIAYAKVLLVNGDHPQDRMEALFNPKELNIRVRAQAGRLHPIGWSHPIKQYAYTEEVGFSLTFLFTRLAMSYGGAAVGRKIRGPNEQAQPSVREPVAWLTSFCFAPAPGKAPYHMMVVWPNVMLMATTVDTVSEAWKRFSPDLTGVEVAVTVGFSESRFQFRDTNMMREGWGRYDDNWSDSTDGSWLDLTGSRTRMGGAGR